MHWHIFKRGLFLVFLILTLNANTAIYDCFPFFQELDVLEIRLNELDPVVDKFVLVESVETYQGNLKPMYFKENKERFQKFLPKIIYIEVQNRITTSNPWERERFQRAQIARGLKGCNGNDLILVSDVDEIWNPKILPEILAGLNQSPIVVCKQP